MRDDFTSKTRSGVEARAGFRCSFTDCGRLTAGPSEESPDEIARCGVAAHICAAAEGGPRYSKEMTPEVRSHIDNATWLCASHARQIDDDTARYTVEALRQMKSVRETAVAAEFRNLLQNPGFGRDLIQLGTGILFTGQYSSIAETEWVFHIQHFLMGDPQSIATFVGSFSGVAQDDRYILSAELGDGRQLLGAPIFSREGNVSILRCPVSPRERRKRAQELGSTMAVSPETNDIFIKDGQIARVSGLEALPQLLRSNLSLQQGEWFMDAKSGARTAEYFSTYEGSPWLARIMKLELIRQTSIPYPSRLKESAQLPLPCVDRVRDLVIQDVKPVDGWIPVRLDLDVHGVGSWTTEISVLIELKRSRGSK